MKLFLPIILLIIFSSPIFSQSYQTHIAYNKKKQKAIAIDYAYSQEAVQNAILHRIEKLGHTGKQEKGIFNRDKGFFIFPNAVVSAINEESMDYILKIEKKSRKEQEETTLYLVLNKGGEDAIHTMSAQDIRKVKEFLNNFLPEVEEANLELQIKAQDDSIINSEKKFKALQDDKAELEKKLQKNLESLEIQQKQIENQRATLELLRGKRKTAI